MKVSVVKKEDLKHEYRVTVPAKTINERLAYRLQQVGQEAKLPGFRPGKVPMPILKQKFGQRVMGEVLEGVIQETSQKAINDEKLRAASQPRIKVEAFDDGKDLEYTLTVELIPDFKIVDFKKIKLEKPVAKVTDKEINDALNRFAEQFKEPKPIKEKRAAKEGDVAIIDFVGRIDGEEFSGGSGTDTQIHVGAQRFLPEFEAGVKGMKAGGTTKVDVNFPEDYGSKAVAGKKAVFEITLKEICKLEDPKLDDELAVKAGFKDMDALRSGIEEHIEAEFSGASRMKLKRALLDELATKYDFDLPQGLYQAELQNITQQYKQSQNPEAAMQQAVDQDNSKAGDQDIDTKTRKELEGIAVRRVRLGLVLAEVGRIEGLQVNDDEIRQAVLREAQNYPGQEQKVLEYFQNNPQAAASLSAPILEDKVVDYILEQAEIKEKTVSSDALFAEDHDHDHGAKKTGKKATTKKAASSKPAGQQTTKKKASTAKKPAAKKPAKKTAAKKSTAKKSSKKS